MASRWLITIWCCTYARKSKHVARTSVRETSEGDPRVAFVLSAACAGLHMVPTGFALDFCSDDHFLGVSQGFLGEINAAQHPCDFFDALVFAQFGNRCAGGIFAAYFMHK
ncbi:hypothetical protein D9M71_787540 [compost metagenome]